MPRNLFADLPATSAEEVVRSLVRRPGLRLESIVSTGQASPPGFWYEQADDEWVVLLRGAAALRFADEGEALALSPGDHLFIAAGRRHRVEWTAADQPTVWLALHLAAAPAIDGGEQA